MFSRLSRVAAPTSEDAGSSKPAARSRARKPTAIEPGTISDASAARRVRPHAPAEARAPGSAGLTEALDGSRAPPVACSVLLCRPRLPAKPNFARRGFGHCSRNLPRPRALSAAPRAPSPAPRGRSARLAEGGLAHGGDRLLEQCGVAAPHTPAHTPLIEDCLERAAVPASRCQRRALLRLRPRAGERRPHVRLVQLAETVGLRCGACSHAWLLRAGGLEKEAPGRSAGRRRARGWRGSRGPRSPQTSGSGTRPRPLRPPARPPAPAWHARTRGTRMQSAPCEPRPAPGHGIAPVLSQGSGDLRPRGKGR